MIKKSFPPVADAGTRLLVLGSLPGAKSLAAGRYYAHPTNQFWRLIGLVLDEDLHGLDYDQRLARLRAGGIGLWDVVSAAEREGSLDVAIRNARTNDFGGLSRDYPDLRAIAFNGGTAAKLGRRILADAPFALIDLPSSSAANTSGLAAKSPAWSALAAHLN
jgi:double-stranded uracil-DNA glycosylase